MGLIDNLLNGKLKRFFTREIEAGLYILFGQRGSGKSTLMSFASQLNYRNMPIFSNYGFDNCYKLPYKTMQITAKGSGRVIQKMIFNKETLYYSDFHDCFILIDEGKTIWSNRNYKEWSADDDNFINFLRKRNIVLIVATQDYEGLDLNIRKACNLYFYMRRADVFKNISCIEMYTSEVLPVVDKELEVRSGLFKKPFNLMSFQVGAVLCGKFRFYRKPYYKYFDTNEIQEVKKFPVPLLRFENRKYNDDFEVV